MNMISSVLTVQSVEEESANTESIRQFVRNVRDPKYVNMTRLEADVKSVREVLYANTTEEETAVKSVMSTGI